MEITILDNFTCCNFQWLGPTVAKQFRNMIDSFAAGKSVKPEIDENGELKVPEPEMPNPEANNFMGFPIGNIVNALGNLPVGNLNLLGGMNNNNGLSGRDLGLPPGNRNNNGTDVQNILNGNQNNNKKRSKPKFSE